MSRSASPSPIPPAQPPKAPLPQVPRQALDAQQRLDALKRLQEQIEHRSKLGVQLFKAAEARVSDVQQVIAEIKAEQAQLRARLESNPVTSPAPAAPAPAAIDPDRIDASLANLHQRIDAIEQRLRESQQQTAQLAKRLDELITKPLPAPPAVAPPAPPALPVRPIVPDPLAQRDVQEHARLDDTLTKLTQMRDKIRKLRDKQVEDKTFYGKIIDELRDQQGGNRHAA